MFTLVLANKPNANSRTSYIQAIFLRHWTTGVSDASMARCMVAGKTSSLAWRRTVTVKIQILKVEKKKMNSSLFYLVSDIVSSELSAECAGKQTTSATRKINIMLVKKMQHLEKCAGFIWRIAKDF